MKDEILQAIIEICWNTLELWHTGEKKENIIHWFTCDIMDYLNDYYINKEPTNE